MTPTSFPYFTITSGLSGTESSVVAEETAHIRFGWDFSLSSFKASNACHHFPQRSHPASRREQSRCLNWVPTRPLALCSLPRPKQEKYTLAPFELVCRGPWGHRFGDMRYIFCLQRDPRWFSPVTARMQTPDTALMPASSSYQLGTIRTSHASLRSEAASSKIPRFSAQIELNRRRE